MMKTKLLTLLTMLLAVSITSCSPSKTSKGDLNEYFVNATMLRVREKPNKKANIIDNLTNGISVTLIEKSNVKEKISKKNGEWYKIKTPCGKTGFVFNKFLIKDKNKVNQKKYLNFTQKINKFWNNPVKIKFDFKSVCSKNLKDKIIKAFGNPVKIIKEENKDIHDADKKILTYKFTYNSYAFNILEKSDKSNQCLTEFIILKDDIDIKHGITFGMSRECIKNIFGRSFEIKSNNMVYNCGGEHENLEIIFQFDKTGLSKIEFSVMPM